MSVQNAQSRPAAHEEFAQMRARNSKSSTTQIADNFDTPRLPCQLKKTSLGSELIWDGDKAAEDNYDGLTTTDGFEDAETITQPHRPTRPPRTSLDVPASFYNLSSTGHSTKTNVLSQKSPATQSNASTLKELTSTSNLSSTFPVPSFHSQVNAPSRRSESSAPSTSLRLNITNQSKESSNVRSPRFVYLNFASTQVDASGLVGPVKRALLRNIRGFPVDIDEIKTIPALNSILLTYFADTLKYYGLSLQHLSGYAAIFHSNTAGSYSLPLGPASTHESWRKVFDYLVGRTMPQDHCPDRKCSHCQNPPFVLACIDETALCNALLSKNVSLHIDLEFLDSAATVLSTKIDRSSDEFKFAYTQLKTEAANGLLVQSLASTAPNTHRHNLGPLSQYQADLFSYGQYIGRVPLPMSLAPIIPTVVSQGNNLAIAAHVLPPPRTQLMSAAPPSLANNPSVAGPLKRAANSTTDDAPAAKKRRTDWGSETPPKLNSEKVKDWTKAVPKPTGNRKALTDTCLTCIHYGRACKGTTVNDKGRCMNCQGGEKGTTKRKCYWQDKEEGILTYENARAADESARMLPQNTRAERALRNRSQTPSITSQPSFTTGLIQHAMIPYPNYSPTINNQTSRHASQYYTSSDLAATTETPGTDTVVVDSPTNMSPVNDNEDDDPLRYFDQAAYDHALSSYTHSTAATNNEREYNEQGSTVGTNKENSPEAEEITEKM